MKDLSVLDVQRELKRHRDYGHDVLTNPSQTIFEDVPYQARVATILTIRDNNSPLALSGLVSHLMQSERPVISSLISTYHDHQRKPHSTIVQVGTPSVTVPHKKSDYSEYGSNFHFWGPGSSVEHFAPKLYFYGDERDASVERWPEAFARTPHEALQNHVTSPFNTIGLHREPTGLDNYSYNLTHPKTLNDFKTPFNLKEALYKLSNFDFGNSTSTDIPPFSNVIRVRQPGVSTMAESQNYLYFPETEQLHKVNVP